MTISELLQYIQDYLHTNDTKTVGYIPTFLSIACLRVKSRLTSTLIEKSTNYVPTASQALPTDFIVARAIAVNDIVLSWLPPFDFAARVATGGEPLEFDPSTSLYYTIQANTLKIWPTPPLAATGTLNYYGFNPAIPTELAELLPSLLIRATAAEAYRYEGDPESALVEEDAFNRELQAAQEMTYWSNGPMSVAGVQ